MKTWQYMGHDDLAKGVLDPTEVTANITSVFFSELLFCEQTSKKLDDALGNLPAACWNFHFLASRIVHFGHAFSSFNFI